MVSFFGWGSSSNSDSNTPKTQETPSNPPVSTTPESKPTSSSLISESRPLPPPSPRNNTNLKLLIGGAAFFSLSVWITRRASIKKQIACIPPFYTSSLFHQPKVNGAGEAFEALNLATINVLSFGMMTGGAVMYGLDINGLDDARRFMRVAMDGGVDDAGKSDEQLEADVTEWVTSVLGDRFQKQLEKERAKKQLEKPVEAGTQ